MIGLGKIGQRSEDRFVIGGSVKDWRVGQRLAVNWHQIGNINILLCKCSSRIGIGLTLNWQIGLGLTKLPGIIGLVSDL